MFSDFGWYATRSCHDSVILSDQYQVYDQKVDFSEVFGWQLKQNVLKLWVY